MPFVARAISISLSLLLPFCQHSTGAGAAAERGPRIRLGWRSPTPAVNCQPTTDDSHLKLGLTREGMVKFLQKIGFAETTPRDGGNSRVGYMKSYRRKEALASWLDKEVGELKEVCECESMCRCTVGTEKSTYNTGGFYNITGYDLAEYLRDWLEGMRHDDLSICEVISKDRAYENLREFGGSATAFWSHVQSQSFLGDDTFRHGERVGASSIHAMQFNDHHETYWIDYFCLRQCRKDFEPQKIVNLICGIGIFVAHIDDELAYLRRAFCALELFAALEGRCKIRMSINKFRSKRDMNIYLASAPIHMESCQTRNPNDKDLIDAYVRKMPKGYERFNEVVTKALIVYTVCN